MFVKERTRKRPLGAGLPQHVILLGRQELAPLVVGMSDLVRISRGRRNGGMRSRQTQRAKRQSDCAGEEDMSAGEHAPFLLSRVSFDLIHCTANFTGNDGPARNLMMACEKLTQS